MDQIIEWAKELQSLAQAGLFYGHDIYDKERYQRIREISAEMMLTRADIPVEKIKGLFCMRERKMVVAGWMVRIQSFSGRQYR